MAIAPAPVRSAPVRSARRASRATQERLGESVRRHRARVTAGGEARLSRQVASEYFLSIEQQIARKLRPYLGGAEFANPEEKNRAIVWLKELEPDDFNVDKLVDWEQAEKDLGRVVTRNAVAIDRAVFNGLAQLLTSAPAGADFDADLEVFNARFDLREELLQGAQEGAVVGDFQLGGGLDRAQMAAIGERVRGINDVGRGFLRDTIRKGLDVGDSPQQIAKALISQVGNWRGKDGTIAHSRAMVIARTETGIIYNTSSVIRTAQTGLVDDMICLDNPDCGWIGHDSGDKANGTIRTFEDALAHPLSHPNCVRAFAPNVEGLEAKPPAPVNSDDEWEEVIQNGHVTDQAFLGGGINTTFTAKIAGRKVVVKPMAGLHSIGQLRTGVPLGGDDAREYGAFLVNKALGNLVNMPRVTVRDFDWPASPDPKNKRAVVVEWVEATPSKALGTLGSTNYSDPELRALALFDSIIGNTDRHAMNYMTGPGGKLVAIDHGLAFPQPVQADHFLTGWDRERGNYGSLDTVWPIGTRTIESFGGRSVLRSEENLGYLTPGERALLVEFKRKRRELVIELADAGLEAKAIHDMFDRVDFMLAEDRILSEEDWSSDRGGYKWISKFEQRRRQIEAQIAAQEAQQ